MYVDPVQYKFPKLCAHGHGGARGFMQLVGTWILTSQFCTDIMHALIDQLAEGNAIAEFWFGTCQSLS